MSGGERFGSAGGPFRCIVCGHRDFRRRKVLLNTRTASFLGLDFLDEAAEVLICRGCGHVHWFVPSSGGLEDELDCPSCGETIPADREQCASCGWTYKTPVVSQ